MRVDAAVIKRLMDHRRVCRHDARSHEAEGWAWVFVEAREVDCRLDRIAARVDHRDGVRILVRDEDPVIGPDAALSRLRRGSDEWTKITLDAIASGNISSVLAPTRGSLLN